MRVGGIGDWKWGLLWRGEICANYGDDEIGDYDDVGYGDGVGGNGDDYDDNDDDAAGVAIGDWKWWLLRRGVVPITVVASPTPRPSRHALTSYIVLTLFFLGQKKSRNGCTYCHCLRMPKPLLTYITENPPGEGSSTRGGVPKLYVSCERLCA